MEINGCRQEEAVLPGAATPQVFLPVRTPIGGAQGEVGRSLRNRTAVVGVADCGQAVGLMKAHGLPSSRVAALSNPVVVSSHSMQL